MTNIDIKCSSQIWILRFINMINAKFKDVFTQIVLQFSIIIFQFLNYQHKIYS